MVDTLPTYLVDPTFIVALCAVVIALFIAIIEIWYKPKWDYTKELKIRVITNIFPKILGDLRITIENTRKTYNDYFAEINVFPYLTGIRTSGEIEFVKFIDETLYTELNDQYSELKPLLDAHLGNRRNFNKEMRKSLGDFLLSKDEITFQVDVFIGWCSDIEYYAWSEDNSKVQKSIREGYDKMKSQRDGVDGLSPEYIEEMTELTIEVAQDLKEKREDIENLFVNNIESNIIEKLKQYLRKPV